MDDHVVRLAEVVLEDLEQPIEILLRAEERPAAVGCSSTLRRRSPPRAGAERAGRGPGSGRRVEIEAVIVDHEGAVPDRRHGDLEEGALLLARDRRVGERERRKPQGCQQQTEERVRKRMLNPSWSGPTVRRTAHHPRPPTENQAHPTREWVPTAIRPGGVKTRSRMRYGSQLAPSTWYRPNSSWVMARPPASASARARASQLSSRSWVRS